MKKNIIFSIIIVVLTILGAVFIIINNKPEISANDIIEKMKSIYDSYEENYNIIEGLGSIEVDIGRSDLPKKTTYSDELDRSTAIKLAEEFSEIMGTHYELVERDGVSDKKMFVIKADTLRVNIHFKQEE